MAEKVISLKEWVLNTRGWNLVFASEKSKQSNDVKVEEEFNSYSGNLPS